MNKCFWLIGLSGAGKTTLSNNVVEILDNDFLIKVLDGDILRNGLNNNLSFSIEDRNENIRRVAEVTKLFLDSGFTVINSFITPTEEMRQIARNILGDQYIEVFVDASLSVCESRDVKGLYKKARSGEIKNFTGIDSVFETPLKPDIIIDTTKSISDSVEKLLNEIKKHQ
jgi:adenylyl-sulfate kinase